MKKSILFMILLGLAAVPARAGINVTLNPQTGSTDVLNGILTLDELQTHLTWTYVNVGGGGFDIKVSSNNNMVNSTGELNYTLGDYKNSSLSFEFFDTVTHNPVLISGFTTSWLDLDKIYGGSAGPFIIVGAGGTQTLNTSTSIFTLGSSLTAVDLGSGFTDGILSSADGDWDNPGTQFVLASPPISKLTLVSTTDWIAPTGTMTLQIVPLPATILLGLLGLGVGGLKLRKTLK